MAVIAPARLVALAVGLATAGRHLDEPGGAMKLHALADGLTDHDAKGVAVVLARLAGKSLTDEQLQALGVGAASSSDPVIL